MSNNHDHIDDANWQVDSNGGVQFIPSGLTIGGNTPKSQPPASTEGSGVHQGSFSYDAGGEVINRRVTQADSGAPIDTRSVLGTYRSNFGSPSSNYQASGTVAVDPNNPELLRTSIANALHMGIIKQGPGGTYVDAFEGTPTAGDIEDRVLGPQDEEESTAELFPAAEQAAFDGRIEPLPQELYDANIASGTLHVAAGMDPESVIATIGERLAQQVGGSPDEHAETARMGFTAFQTQVANTLEGMGIPHGTHELIWDFARSTEAGRNELQQALTQLAFARSTAGFKALAERFLRQASPSAKYLKAAGVRTRNIGSRGLEVEEDDGVWTRASELRYEATMRRK